MKYTYFNLLPFAMYSSISECALPPDINLEGRLLTNNDNKIVQLICTTNIAVQLCTVEFLVNKRTHDYIRYYDNNCYPSISTCSPKVCTCSDDCMSFTLNVTVPKDITNHLYGCESKIENEGVIYFANITVIQDDNGGFELFKKIVIPYSRVSPTLKATTFTPEISTVSIPSGPFYIAVAAFGCLFLSLSLLVVCSLKNSILKKARYWSKHNNALCYKQTDKDRSTNDTRCHQQNDKNNSHGTPNHHILNKEDSSGINSSKREGVHQVKAEINSDGNGTRFSMASTISDSISVDCLINNSSNRSGVKLSEKIESTYI